jgi:ribosomal protein S18 acetylase RimI-like enzyme
MIGAGFVTDAPVVSIRRLASSDLDCVIAGWHATNRSSYRYVAEIRRHTFADDRSFFVERLIPACEVWVAECAGTVAGMLALDTPWIRHFAVFEGYRGKGIGTRLLQRARARSPRGLRLFTFQRNVGARRFYERHGFRLVALGVSPAPESEPDVEYAWEPVPDD